MHLYITSSNSLDTKFVTDDDILWYTVETSQKVGNQTTTITRHKPRSAVVGQIIWRTAEQSLIRFESVQLERNSFLRSNGAFSSHKYMTGSDGLQYEWKKTGSDPELWSPTSGKRVAYYVPKSIFKGRKRHLVIDPEAEPTMDVIIIAFIMIDKRKRDMEATIATTSGAANVIIIAANS